MSRLVSAGAIVRSQVDIYTPPTSVTRKTGETAGQITLSIFFDNYKLSWPLVDGTTVPDSSISSGTVYFNEIPGSPGFYSVRFFPDRVGFWRLILLEASLGEESKLEFDVVPPGVFSPNNNPNGLNASFIPNS